MNKVIVMLLVCLAFVGWGVSFARAQANIIKGGCGLLSVDSEGNLEFPVMIVQGQAVQAANPSGNTLIKCRGQMPHSLSKQVTLDYSSTKLAIGTGLYCFTPWGDATQTWQQVITPSGQATLTCHLNGNSKK